MAYASLIRNFHNFTCRVLSTSNRLVHNVSPNVWEEKHRSESDKPTFMRNPYKYKKQECILCKLNIKPDYKNVRLLSQFQSRFTGRIYGRHITGLCKNQQRKVEQEILKAQNAGLMGYYTKDVAFCKDPKLFDPNHPFRPHKY
ncbi:28S ribosomal protein S18c, mitochondrial [Cephus cinctus]|uniref:28S ribosomal protein S18c, mitochondrial n=1 Tax=Cephus cinctus TaxID=211228 RepID=A0AAJ7BFV1_CEPCN|nr:28S ribosomal protein S18c, mitochondrial [Cephus cinctus]